MVQVRLIDIQVHHAGIGTPDLCKVRVTEAAAHLSRAAPVFDLRLYLRVSAFHHARDYGVAFSCPLQVGNHLADSAAGVQLAQPGRRIRMFIIRRFFLLDIHKDNRHIQVTDRREHIVRSRVGQQLQDDQIHVGRTEFIAGRGRQLLGSDQSPVDQFHRIRNHLFKRFILRLKFRHKGRELRQISAQRDGENTDSCFCIDQHKLTSQNSSSLLKNLFCISMSFCSL